MEERWGRRRRGLSGWIPQRTSPYDYYQFWINTDDRDVKRFLALFTFLPMDEVEEYGKLQGSEIRKAKEILAFEATKIVHGEEEAKKARDASSALFSKEETNEDAIPTKVMDRKKFIEGIPIFKLFEATSLCSSGSEARRLIEQGGGYLNTKGWINLTFLSN